MSVDVVIVDRSNWEIYYPGPVVGSVYSIRDFPYCRTFSGGPDSGHAGIIGRKDGTFATVMRAVRWSTGQRSRGNPQSPIPQSPIKEAP